MPTIKSFDPGISALFEHVVLDNMLKAHPPTPLPCMPNCDATDELMVIVEGHL